MIRKLGTDLLCSGDASEGVKINLSKVISASIAFSTLVWVSYIVFKTHSLPNLTDAAAFIVAGATYHLGGKYLASKEPPPNGNPAPEVKK